VTPTPSARSARFGSTVNHIDPAGPTIESNLRAAFEWLRRKFDARE
jgi:hypothetical protein